jgi:hypothetical protein
MEYKIVMSSGWTPDSIMKELEKKVNDLIKEGWEPIGGVLLPSLSENAYQTLIKRSPK